MKKEEDVRISPRTGKPIDKKSSPAKTLHKKKNIDPVKMRLRGFNIEDGDNNKITKMNIELFNLPAIDLDDEEQVADQLTRYFSIYAKYDMKPTVAGMALSLNGMDRRTLLAIVNDTPTGGNGYKSALPKSVANVIKKAYRIMETLWESYMNSGKMNPVSGIFLGKNNFGYLDKVEHVVTPKQETEIDAESIKERYINAESYQKTLPDKES